MPPQTKAQREAKAQRDKIRRQSRGSADIRRDQDLQNAARLRASQRSQSSEQDLPMYHPDPAPNISSSSYLRYLYRTVTYATLSPLLVHPRGLDLLCS